MKNNGKQLLSQRAFAKLVGCSQPYISKLVRQGRIPRHAGGIDEAEGRRALAQVADVTATPTSFAEAQRRWRLATAQLRELELRQKEGGLVYAADVRREVERTFMNVRTALLALPVKLAPCLSAAKTPAEVSELLRCEIYSVLQHLADHAADNPFELPEDSLTTERPV